MKQTLVTFFVLENFKMTLPRSLRNYPKLVLLLVLVSLMVGCAAPAKRDNMSISAVERSQFSDDRFLSGTVSVGSVTGGKDTNPMWTSEIGSVEFEAALRDSLETARLFTNHALSEYELDATLIEIDQPMFGFTFDVVSTIEYTLRNKSSRATVLQETIVATGTASTGDAFAGVKRLRIANERSAQENIKRIIDRLYNWSE
jgi:hypothetical protein